MVPNTLRNNPITEQKNRYIVDVSFYTRTDAEYLVEDETIEKAQEKLLSAIKENIPDVKELTVTAAYEFNEQMLNVSPNIN